MKKKKQKKSLSLLLALIPAILSAALPGLCARADNEENGTAPYTYTVTIYSGDKGYFAQDAAAVAVSAGASDAVKTELAGDNSRIVISGLSYGDRISVNFIKVPLYAEYEGVYSAWGVREAGRDSSTAEEAVGKDVTEPPSFPVTQDADYVIAYSLLTDPVPYTVRYLEAASGRELKASQTGYADHLKTICIGAEAVSGYVPDARNKSLTLNKNAEKNEIIFTYTAIGTRTVTNTVTETETITETQTQYVPGGTEEINLGAAAGSAAGADDAAAETGEEGEEQAVVVLEDEEIPLGSGIEAPKELVNLDDGETPLGLPGLDESGASKSLLFVYIATALLGALGFFGILFFLLRRKKEEETGDAAG